MSRCARDSTKLVFSSSLSDFPSWKENVCDPKSNNFFSKVLELAVGFPLIFLQASGGIFVASIIRYITFVPKPEEVQSSNSSEEASVETNEKFRCRIHRRQHALQDVQVYLHYCSNSPDLLWFLV